MSSQTLEVNTMDEDFENFNDQDEEWLTELEIRATDLENELYDWREAHARELAETSYGRTGHRARPGMPPRGLRAQPRQAAPSETPPAEPSQARPTGRRTAAPRTGAERRPDRHPDGARPGWPGARRTSAERTQTLIDRGRRSHGRARNVALPQDRAGRCRSGRGGRHRVGAPLQSNPSCRRAWPRFKAR